MDQGNWHQVPGPREGGSSCGRPPCWQRDHAPCQDPPRTRSTPPAQKHRPDGRPVSSGGESLLHAGRPCGAWSARGPLGPTLLPHSRHGRRGHGLRSADLASYVSLGRKRAATRQTTWIRSGMKKGTDAKKGTGTKKGTGVIHPGNGKNQESRRAPALQVSTAKRSRMEGLEAFIGRGRLLPCVAPVWGPQKQEAREVVLAGLWESPGLCSLQRVRAAVRLPGSHNSTPSIAPPSPLDNPAAGPTEVRECKHVHPRKGRGAVVHPNSKGEG